MNVLRVEWFVMFMKRPGSIVNCAKIVNKFISFLIIEMPEVVLWFFGNPFCYFPETFGKGNGIIQVVTILFKINLKTIVTKQFFVVRRIVWHTKPLLHKT